MKNWRRFERQLIKIGMLIILIMCIAIYFMLKKWAIVPQRVMMGPPTPSEVYYAHKAEIILWYDKFVIPFVAPAFFYWFHRFIDARYKKKDQETAD